MNDFFCPHDRKSWLYGCLLKGDKNPPGSKYHIKAAECVRWKEEGRNLFFFGPVILAKDVKMDIKSNFIN